MHAYIVSLYPEGARKAADCIPDFYASTESAVAAGNAWVKHAENSRNAWDSDDPIAWVHRFTVRRVRLSQ